MEQPKQPQSDVAYTSALAGDALTVSAVEAALQKVAAEWDRQKALFPVLASDGWMDLAISEARATARKKANVAQAVLTALQEVLERIIPGSLASVVRNRAESAIAAATGSAE
jgi:hypothetical protein